MKIWRTVHQPQTDGSSSQKKGSYLWLVAVVVIVLVYVGGWLGLIYALETGNPVTVVEGTSMLPTLHEGDIVVLRGASAEEILKDFQSGQKDIIVYTVADGRHIIHRIYNVKYDDSGNLVGFIVKGDNVPAPDPWIVTEKMILGKVVAGPIPYVGIVILFLRSNAGYGTLTIVIVLLVLWTAVSELRKRSKEVKPIQV